MENVVLTIHLILALLLIAVVLLQRSEGGGLGMGGGGAMTGRAAATALGKLTWIFAGAFICTSIALTVIAARNAAGVSVVDQFGGTPPAKEEAPATPDASTLLPPVPADAPQAPPRADATAPADGTQTGTDTAPADGKPAGN